MTPIHWHPVLRRHAEEPSWRALQTFVAAERRTEVVYPPPADVYAALDLTAFADTRVVVLGQDPYHGPGQAHGLSFSVRRGTKVPPSLRNIHKELRDDVGVPVPDHGNLEAWARSGVLLLNTVLTVRAGQAGSHRGRGWEDFTDLVIRALSSAADPVVFILWGADARRARALVDTTRHTVIESAHPSPLSARHGFFGSRPFSRANAALVAAGRSPIDWDLSGDRSSQPETARDLDAERPELARFGTVGDHARGGCG